MLPRVTVLMCTNTINSRFFESLKSICLQEYNNILIAVYLDGIDCDKNRNQIQEYCENYGRRYLLCGSKTKAGLTKGLHTLQRRTVGDFFARLDVGDSWLADKVTKQIKECMNNGYTIIGTRSEYVDQEGKLIGYSKNLPEKSEDIKNKIKSQEGLYDHSTILFSSKFEYDIEWYFSQDMKLYVDIANEDGKFGYVPEALTRIMLNPTGITIEKRPLQIYYEREARKRLGCTRGEKVSIKSVEELRPASKTFASCYKKYVHSMQKGKKIKGCIYLIACCFADTRVFEYYWDRLIFKIRQCVR